LDAAFFDSEATGAAGDGVLVSGFVAAIGPGTGAVGGAVSWPAPAAHGSDATCFG